MYSSPAYFVNNIDIQRLYLVSGTSVRKCVDGSYFIDFFFVFSENHGQCSSASGPPSGVGCLPKSLEFLESELRVWGKMAKYTALV